MSVTADTTKPFEMIPVETSERRAKGRTPMTAKLRLFGMGCGEGVACQATDISESGLRVATSLESVLSVGQRYEVVADEGCDNATVASALGRGCYATVVRTVARGDVHAGLRFDRPLLL